ncbi:hypothetical protein FACS18945_6300 [Bacteroidia bacterium]|nr:hypothetical protein FACS18945_6300 [Bacteroidia bacterium]
MKTKKLMIGALMSTICTSAAVAKNLDIFKDIQVASPEIAEGLVNIYQFNHELDCDVEAVSNTFGQDYVKCDDNTFEFDDITESIASTAREGLLEGLCIAIDGEANLIDSRNLICILGDDKEIDAYVIENKKPVATGKASYNKSNCETSNIGGVKLVTEYDSDDNTCTITIED